MITAGSLMDLSERELGAPCDQPSPKLSVILVGRFPHEESTVRSMVNRLAGYRPQVEIVVVFEPSVASGLLPEEFVSWCVQQGCRVLTPSVPCGLPSLRLNEGILMSHGQWIWLLNARNPMPTSDPSSILNLLENSPEETVGILVHPEDEGNIIDIPGVKRAWIDMFYKGWQFPLENMLFPRALFDIHGLLDPHIVMAPFYGQEFLLRVCRFVRFLKIDDPGAVAGIRQGKFPSILYFWLDVNRTPFLLPNRLSDYSVDGFENVWKAIPKSHLWAAYLTFLLPYYYEFRHLIREGWPKKVQSLPPAYRHVVLVKSGDYETGIDVGFRNFDVFAQGERSLKLSLIHLSQIDSSQGVQADGLVLVRSADHGGRDLAKKAAQEGISVGYSMDDDLLNLHQLGGGFAAFRPGNPHYDAMVDTVKAVDVVLCGGSHVRRSLSQHNLRTVHFEGSVLPRFLPQEGAKKKSTPFRFGYAGGSYRAEEMKMLWPAIERICLEYGDRVHFEFWGIDPKDLPHPVSQVSFVPFSINYYEYLTRLNQNGFDAMLVPLFSNPPPRRGKLPNKLYETAVAGAVGLYSDVPTYEVVRTNRLGLTVGENTEAWYGAMHQMLEMSEEGYGDLYARSQAFVREFYTTPAMLPVHEYGMQALLFHGATRAARGSDGRPVVVYVFPSVSEFAGGVVSLKRRIELAIQAGISPFVVVWTEAKEERDWVSFQNFLTENKIDHEFVRYRRYPGTPPRDEQEILPFAEEVTEMRAVLTKRPIALVDTAGYIPSLGGLCSELDIPFVSGHYGVDDDYQWPQGHLPFKYCDLVHSDSIHYSRKWSELLRCDWFCARDTVPEHLFEIGFDRLYGQPPEPDPNHPIRLGVVGSLFPRKSQLEVIQALSLLVQEGLHHLRLTFYGPMDAIPRYRLKCQKAVEALKLKDHVAFRGYVPDLGGIYSNLDILISASSFESFATPIKEATSSGTLVIASGVGGIAELIKDGVNGILTQGVKPKQIAQAIRRAIHLSASDRLRLRRNAYRMAREEFHPRQGLSDVLTMYNLALQIHGASRNQVALEGSVMVRGGHIRMPEAQAGTVVPPSHPVKSHLLVGNGVTYRLTPQRANWKGLDVLVGTHERAASGLLNLRVFSQSGQVLRDISVDLAQAHDNDWMEFRFKPIVNSDGIPYIVAFRVIHGGPQTRVSLYGSAPPEGLSRRLLRHAGSRLEGKDLYCRLWHAD